MKTTTLIILSLLISSLFKDANSLKCGENEIENCKKCGEEEESDICAICQDDYFPLLENLICLSCKDPINGQPGCKGKCETINSNSYSNNGLNICQECEEGYYLSNGQCIECTQGCASCKFDGEDNNLKCLKCINEKEYRLSNNFNCESCKSSLNNCNECHFDEDSQPKCDECLEGYYLDASNNCLECSYQYITGGRCYKCSSDSKLENCYCDSGYVLVDNSCKSCLGNCDRCEFNQNSPKCLKCLKGYYLNSERKCEPCQNGCQYCELDNTNKQKCLACSNNQILTDDNQCLYPPDNCLDYKYDSTNKKMICVSCDSNYVLDPETKQCKSCYSISELGQGCNACIYNSIKKKYECEGCYSSNSYCYVKNELKCYSNTDPDKTGLYYCEIAQYNESTKKYECLQCQNDNNLILIDKSCNLLSTLGLYDYCLEVEKKGEKYSCKKCNSNYAIVEDISTHIKTCQERKESLSYCLEGKYENKQYVCNRCVDNALLNDNKCNCNSDSFSRDSYSCYKCNDIQGEAGCNETAGCNIDFYNEVSCNQCKDGYYKTSQGKCLLCSSEISNCGKCYWDDSYINPRAVCEKCINNIYTLNKTINKCQLNDCDEYPDISPGCIICKNKLNEYKSKNKCQMCKYGYFKTKEEKCVYCNSEQFGGIGCYECGYETDQNGIETNKIICKECYSNSNLPMLTKDGKCYDCQNQFSEACNECQLIENENGIETLKCVSCKEEYYLTPEGNCVYILNLVPKIPNCITQRFSNQDIQFNIDFTNLNIHAYSNYDSIYTSIYSTGLSGFESKCIKCESNYVLNDGKCELLKETCSFNSIMKNYNKLYSICQSFCSSSDKVIIKYAKKIEGKLYELSINGFSLDNYNNFIEYFKDNNQIKACLRNSGEGGDYAPANLKNCHYAYYFPENNTYDCISCFYGYTLETITHLCSVSNHDEIENIGTEIKPIYADTQNYYTLYYTLVTYENGESEYIRAIGNLSNCVEAKANTEYLYTKYDCTKCLSEYIPFYSKYYERKICQHFQEEIKRENDNIYFVGDSVKANNGVCEKDYLFTPDEENCYKCDDESVGMKGCKGGCNYSNKRNNTIKCEGKCKKGYLEISEGNCQECSDINPGCHECSYDDEGKYPNDYKGIKRKRRFVCDYCEEGYMQSSSGECVTCFSLGLDNCNQCEIDSNNNNYVCSKCAVNYFINEKGKCETCDQYHFKGIDKAECFDCDNSSEGGIDKCHVCDLDKEKVICKECLPGYILSTEDNSCLEIAKNKDLEKLVNCEQIEKDNDKYICSKCTKNYVLIKKNIKNECIYIRSLYDPNFENYYNKHFIFLYGSEPTTTDKENYIYDKQINYAPCQEAVNLGTKENPFYSCIKCYEDPKIINNNEIIKVTDINYNLSYCLNWTIIKTPQLSDCVEATHKIKNGNEEYNCTKCIKNYDLIYDSNSNSFSCKFSYASYKCLVLYCKECDPNDGYICNECQPDFEINNATGSCVKKTSVLPEITWKSIYNLNMQGSKALHDKINPSTTKYIYGPSFSLRGITTNQINSGHGFFINLIFKKKNRIRNLQEEEEEDKSTIKIPGICEVTEEVEEEEHKMNVVDYQCIGNQTKDLDLTDYKLVNIEEGDNEQFLKKSNFEELVNEVKTLLGDLENMEYIKNPLFTLKDLVKIVIFEMNEKVENIQAKDFKFNFKIEGKLSEEITKEERAINIDFDLFEVDAKVNCIFTIKVNKLADLSCELNVEKYKGVETFSFKTKQIDAGEKEVYLENFSDIKLTNSKEKDYKVLKIVIICVIGVCVIAIGVLIGFVVYLKKTKNKLLNSKIVVHDNNIKNDNTNNDNKNIPEAENKAKNNKKRKKNIHIEEGGGETKIKLKHKNSRPKKKK